LSINSKCYSKFNTSRGHTWYTASNDCLSRGGSLAVFTDIGSPSDNSQLTDWLNTTEYAYDVAFGAVTGPDYAIGLIKSWWNTTDEGNFELLC